VPEADSMVSEWRKSSFSEAGNCVEVAGRAGMVLVRDTKLLAESSVLSFSPSMWREFIHVIGENRLSGAFAVRY
jgi:hypothetical protein